jgi:hypothetical protein
MQLYFFAPLFQFSKNNKNKGKIKKKAYFKGQEHNAVYLRSLIICFMKYQFYNFKKFSFSHNIFMFCVDVRKTAVISLYDLNLLHFLRETECVYCAVRAGFSNEID